MANAKACDLCGNFYVPYGMKDDSKNTNGFMLLNIDNQGKYYSHSATDCCPSCMEKIKNFIEELKKEDMS